MNKINKCKEPLLQVENLSISFKGNGKDIEAVRGVSFDLDKGQLLSIVGQSGSGKSITALSIMQLLPYPTAYHPSGRILFEGNDLMGLPDSKLRGIRGNKISMIFQEPMTSLNPLHTIERQISEILYLHGRLSSEKVKERCRELMDMVELDSLKNRLNIYPHELSGGQRQRVMIAMALACEPDLLIADEPTTALDVTVQAQILKLLKNLQNKLGMAILMITHDLTIVRKISDNVCVMNDGELVETADTKTIFSKPQHEYTKHLLSSEPKGGAVKLPANAKTILRTDDLNVSFPIKRNFFGTPVSFVDAVKHATIDLKQGETLGIVGESGSGKSTLAMAILRLVSSKGVIDFDRRRIDIFDGKSMRPLRKEIQIVFQDPFASLNPRMSLSQIIEEGLKAHNIGTTKQERHTIIGRALTDVGLEQNMLNRYPHEFSGGQRQRIAIARSLVLNPKIIILDEPTSALDLSVQSQIIDLLRKLQKEKLISYIFISHDLRVIKAISHRILVMKDGDIVESGTVSDIFDKPAKDYTKELIKASGV
ncbi:MAG: ABC transporter ATP-binding protein [Rickettsiales bacterium]|nr:ABC transporter ATP-binding protein [Pseudomonadota bacterium]MDA0966914.1 ABC transporter ATP-binding protein [Pseudomonadota bacterium]MDG4544467.1 ABC transporter ATP-binding protein [Rickettsiales bacterium]MDG4546618.1 ABC transporter ATP-binding protein [Rickettsiales bacterium]MDG4548743.1 ABC transporter ATP-binding protein [Rickettsiales bacterium]